MIIKRINISIILFLTIVNFLLCQTVSKINYSESEEILFNPERGFSSQITSNVTGALISNLKNEKVSVIQKLYVIPQFRNSDLSTDFLESMQFDLDAAREGGVKLVIRFSYTEEQNGQDANLNTILRHIEQIKPILQKNYDVILYMEAGFIGAWGEWYYSTNNLNNTSDRRTVLSALLDALPEERCVVVRTPNYKRLIFNDPNPITLADAFNGTKKSRTGAHNDCFLASATDFGTYLQNDIEGDKNYLNQDNMFVPQGGETCSPSEYSDCNHAITDLQRMHWSVLNKDYNETVLNNWKTNACYQDIQKRLGYRFVLLNSEISDSVKPGGEITVKLKILNKGFASPFNARNVELVLRKTDRTKQYRLETNEDPRYWFSGDTVNVEITGGILNETEVGNYELFLHLADPIIKLHNRPEYAIHLANKNLWEESTGFNFLKHIVKIDSKVQGNNYNGELYFEQDSIANINPANIIIDGDFTDWQTVQQLDNVSEPEGKGDALNPSTDITDVWATDDENNLYISYSLDSTFSDQYFYHIFLDTDSDTSTGFHSEGSFAGIDLMIENDLMWKYTGINGEWSWQQYGNFSSAISNNNKRIEVSIAKDLLNGLGAFNKIGILINVNDDNENVDDDYAPDNYKEKSYNYSYLITSVYAKEKRTVNNAFSITNYPNPFNPTTTIQYNIPFSREGSGVLQNKENGTINSLSAFSVRTNVQLKVYDMLGREITTLVNKLQKPGNYKIIFNASKFSNGIYIVRLQTGSKIISKKIVLLK